MAGPMAALPPRSWANLMVASLHEILSRVPCPEDRHRAYRACRAWRDAVDALPPPKPPRALPWLLLPARYPDSATRFACVLSGCRVHHYLNVIPPDARYFGSHDGAWLLLHRRQTRTNELFNVRTGDVVFLPRELLRPGDPHVVHRMVIHAAALSASPEDENCVGAAIVTSWQSPAPGAVAAVPPGPPRRRCVALWRKGWPQAIDFTPNGDNDPALQAEDVTVIHSGTFLFVTHGEHVRASTPVRHEGNNLSTQWRTFRFRPRTSFCDEYVRDRYLIVTSEKLLMVVRFTPEPNQPTSKFKVFRVTRRKTSDASAGTDADADFPVADYPWSWSELDTLGGLMLFVGHGCTRSYEVDQYPGFKSGIYFLDDGKFYDDADIFGNGNGRYPCNDNGKWSEGRVDRSFPRPDPSDHSAPVWLLP